MSTSSSDDEGGAWVPFSERSEWQDVSPVLQDDGPNPVCRIAYSDRFVDTMNYFRAVLHSKERSPRVLTLLAEVLVLNPANYTAWQLRREVLEVVPFNLEEEREFVFDATVTNPKNYQVWHHRQWLLERANSPLDELEFLEKHIFQYDAKNYHAWTHRQWIVTRFDMWDGEFAFLDRFFDKDVRNNSLWNHRVFVVTRNGTRPMDAETQLAEIAFAEPLLWRAPDNEAAWNFVRGVCRSDAAAARVVALCERALSANVAHAFARALLAHVLTRAFAPALPAPSDADLERAARLYDELADEHDTMRRKYWRLLSRRAQHLRQHAHHTAATAATAQVAQ